MKLCIASDSHGAFGALCAMLEKEQPDTLLFLGDGGPEAQRAGRQFGVPVLCVAGNCDLCSPEPMTHTVTQGGITFFMAHGHRFGVKQGLGAFASAVEQAGAGVGLFGHTHQPYEKAWGSVLLYNPGSMREGCYLLARVEEGKLQASFERVE